VKTSDTRSWGLLLVLALLATGAAIAGGSGGGGSGGGEGSSDSGTRDASTDSGCDDGGSDAGAADAGKADAGSADAGAADAGPADAGSDAGAADAGPADAGAPDSGPADAGSADAGSDAGVSDAGTTSSGGNGTGQMALCSQVTGVSCTTGTQWTVSESSTTPVLTNPSNATAAFQLVVTEGVTARSLKFSDVLTLDGLLQSGTRIAAIYLSVQKGDGQGGFTTVASAAVGDTSNACGCPYVASSMTLVARDGSSVLAGAPLASLGFGQHKTVTVDAAWDLGNGLVQPGDTLRVQPCVTYLPDNVSTAPGCAAAGGSVRATKACSGLSFTCGQATTSTLTEQLAGLSAPIAMLGTFTATTSAPSLSPPSITQTAGGPAITFTATPTGVPGTQSVVNVQGQVTCGSVAGSATLTDTASIGSSSTSASALVKCLGSGLSCADFGAAAPFNVFTQKTFTGTNCDVEGSLAAGGNISISGYAVGALLTGSALGKSLVGGAGLTASSSWIYGDVWVQGSTNVTQGALAAGVVHTQSTGGLDFAAAQTRLAALSAQYGALAANGTLSNQGGALTFTGTDAALNVFSVSASTLATGWQIRVAVPATSAAVINVTGSSASMTNTSFSGTAGPSQTLLNFTQATTLTLSGIGLEGSVLAPLATVKFDNGTLKGQLFASSMQGTGQVNLNPLVACLPIR
jgi:choice-of-anchor A domain-containing protein